MLFERILKHFVKREMTYIGCRTYIQVTRDWWCNVETDFLKLILWFQLLSKRICVCLLTVWVIDVDGWLKNWRLCWVMIELISYSIDGCLIEWLLASNLFNWWRQREFSLNCGCSLDRAPNLTARLMIGLNDWATIELYSDVNIQLLSNRI